MFIPQPRVIERLADCRLNGYPDVNTESFYKGNPQTFDQNENKYNQHERINKVVNNIVVEPDTLTNVNQNGNTQQDYIDTMTNKLANSNFNNIVQPMPAEHWNSEAKQPMPAEHWNSEAKQPVVEHYWNSEAKQPIPAEHWNSEAKHPCTQPVQLPMVVSNGCSNETKPQQNTIMFTILVAAFVVIFVLLFIVFILLTKNKLHDNAYKQLGGNMFTPNGYIPVLSYQFIPNNDHQGGFVPNTNNEHQGGFVPYNY